MFFPASDVRVEGLAARKAARGKAAQEWKVFYDFHFSDRVEENGHLFQSVLPLSFGLGEAASVERIEVLWPSGKKSVLSLDIAINRTLTISEPR